MECHLGKGSIDHRPLARGLVPPVCCEGYIGVLSHDGPYEYDVCRVKQGAD